MDERVAVQVVGRPAPALRAFVSRYVGYEQRGFPPGVHTGTPSRSLTFIVALDKPVDLVAMPDPAQPAEAFDALVGGLHAAPARIRHQGDQRGVQLAVTPHGARALFGFPAAELAARVVALDAVLGATAEGLADRLREASTWPARFAVLDDVLRSRMRTPRLPVPEVRWAWDRIVATAGAIAVGALAAEVGWSRRHLSARFGAEYGLSPKVAARVVRFERARSLLVAGGSTPPNLALVAARSGYADQAHMTREFVALAGWPPAAWLATEAFPDVQDETPPDGAG